jgi:hypothetical protein
MGKGSVVALAVTGQQDAQQDETMKEHLKGRK